MWIRNTEYLGLLTCVIHSADARLPTSNAARCKNWKDQKKKKKRKKERTSARTMLERIVRKKLLDVPIFVCQTNSGTIGEKCRNRFSVKRSTVRLSSFSVAIDFLRGEINHYQEREATLWAIKTRCLNIAKFATRQITGETFRETTPSVSE